MCLMNGIVGRRYMALTLRAEATRSRLGLSYICVMQLSGDITQPLDLRQEYWHAKLIRPTSPPLP